MRELFAPELYPFAIFTFALLFTFTILVLGSVIESISVVSKELTFKLLFNVRLFFQLLKERMMYPVLLSVAYVCVYLFITNYPYVSVSTSY